MRDERVLITGGGGMLGSAVYPYFAGRFKSVLATDKVAGVNGLLVLDVRDDHRLQQVFREFQPDIVLHLAAETDLEYCEFNPDVAEDTNAIATATVARLCHSSGATLVYVSSSAVFDGHKNGFYTENDRPYPIMKYGRTKHDGEILAKAHCQRTFIVRAGWMIGGGPLRDSKFIGKIMQQLGNGAKEIFAVHNLWGTPTYSHDFALNLLELIDTQRYGTYHMACAGACNRYDLAREVLKICRRNDIKLTAVMSDFFREDYFASRPRSEMIANTRLSKLGCNRMRHWSVALREYIENSYGDFIASPEVYGQLSAGGRSADDADKRHNCRQPVNLSFICTLHNGNETWNCVGEALDVSEGGLRLVSDHEMPPQSIVTVRLPFSDSWRRAAMVRWSEYSTHGHLAGLQYLEPPVIHRKQPSRSQYRPEGRSACSVMAA